MKPRGRHPERALTAVKVRNSTHPGRYADGNGLYLVVDPSGAKRWVLRTIVRGKRTDLGLGSVRLVPLADARDEATRLRRIAREGGDPLAERRALRAIPTFREAAETVHAAHSETWRNGKHVDQWISTLKTYAFPHIGDRRVDQIDTADVLRVLLPVWTSKPETARRVRQRIKVVLDWAAVAGHRSAENPAVLVDRGLPPQPDKKNKRHHAAMPYNELSGFVKDLQGSEASEPMRLAFEFLILTAARTGEVIGATRDEIDLDKSVWTIPAERMKAGKPHRIPLAPRCVEIVKRALDLGGSDWLFPGLRPGKPLSNTAFLMHMRRAKVDYVPHGFRSAFRDWIGEQTAFPREIAEAALAHMIENKTEAAYARSDLFERRRKLMAAWADYIGSDGKKVVTLRATR